MSCLLLPLGIVLDTLLADAIEREDEQALEAYRALVMNGFEQLDQAKTLPEIKAMLLTLFIDSAAAVRPDRADAAEQEKF